MRLIIAGGRDFTDYKRLKFETAMFITSQGENITSAEIVSGCCDRGVLTYTRVDGTKVYGADGLGERFAKDNHCLVKLFPADWDKYGSSAGPIRNEEMAAYAEGQYCILFWDRKSRGSRNMKKCAKQYDITLKEVNY